MPSTDAPPPLRASCPECGKPTAAAWRPFCSRLCKTLDLRRWLNEDYRIPADSTGDDEGSSDAQPPGDRQDG